MISLSNHGRPLRGRLFYVFVAVTLLWTANAHGHGADSDQDSGSVRAVLDPIPQELSALRVQLRTTLAPQLLVANPTSKPLTIEDESGRGFLRIGPEQTEGDLGAAAFHRTNTVMAPGAFPQEASGDQRWQVVEATSNWGWFDLRLRTDHVDVPHSVVDGGERTTVARWSIPVTLGDTRSAIGGRFEYVPAASGIAQARVTDPGMLKGQALVRAMPGSSNPGLFLSYRGEEAVTVMGLQGEPFLRFSKRGVDANRNSATWGKVAPPGAPAFIDNGDEAEARWAQVSTTRSYGWIEPRLAYADTPDNAERSQVVKRWQIPVHVGGADSAIGGVTEWQPRQSLAEAGS